MVYKGENRGVLFEDAKVGLERSFKGNFR